MSKPGPDEGERWVLLIHQIPAKPAYVRVKTWRRLQAVGAVPLKNAVHVLPATEQSREDFEWLRKEILEGGGEAIICEAEMMDGVSDEGIRALFNSVRDEEYTEIAEEARALAREVQDANPDESLADIKIQLSRLKKRQAHAVAIDFFDASNRQSADGLISGLETRIMENLKKNEPMAAPFHNTDIRQATGKVWVTRVGVHIDRIACAWLVHRFIDKDALFKFVPPKGYRPEPNELRFDMYEAEFTHEGDKCSFEVLANHAGIDEYAVQAIGEIIHDIDLKDDKYGREEVAGVKALIDGICASTRDDEERLARGGAIFDNLYALFRRLPESKRKPQRLTAKTSSKR